MGFNSGFKGLNFNSHSNLIAISTKSMICPLRVGMTLAESYFLLLPDLNNLAAQLRGSLLNFHRSCQCLYFQYLQFHLFLQNFVCPQAPQFSQHNFFRIQSVPLATEPVIILIILTPIKILQRNLNRSKFFSFTFLTQ